MKDLRFKHLVDKYVLNDLSVSEQSELNDYLKQESFVKEFKEILTITKALKVKERKEMFLLLDDISKETKSTQLSSWKLSVNKRFYYWAAVLVLVLVSSLWLFVNNRNTINHEVYYAEVRYLPKEGLFGFVTRKKKIVYTCCFSDAEYSENDDSITIKGTTPLNSKIEKVTINENFLTLETLNEHLTIPNADN